MSTGSRKTSSILLRLWRSLQPRYFPIAYKLALLITLVIALGMSLLGAIVIKNQTQLLHRQMKAFGQTLAVQTAATAKEPLLTGDSLTLNLLASSMMRHDNVRGLAIYNDEHKAVTQIGLLPSSKMLLSLLQQASSINDILIQDQPPNPAAQINGSTLFLAPISTRDLALGHVLLLLDHAQLNQTKRDTLQAVSTAALFMILLGALTAIWLGRHLARPIGDLMDASLQIFRGNYGKRFTQQRNDELGTLMQTFNTMSEGLQRKEQIEQLFSRYLPPTVARELLSAPGENRLGGQPVEASVLFADIAGFTALSETLSPEEVSLLLNEYFTVIAMAAQAYSGHVDKYMGDCAMLVFGVPEANKDHSLNVVSCAVLIQRLILELGSLRRKKNHLPLSFHISCNSGTMLAGNMGSIDRMEYTVVGDAVNLASRLATVTEPDQILISKAMSKLPALEGKLRVRENNTILLRGKQQPVAIVEVLGLCEDLQLQMEHLLAGILRQHKLRGSA